MKLKVFGSYPLPVVLLCVWVVSPRPRVEMTCGGVGRHRLFSVSDHDENVYNDTWTMPAPHGFAPHFIARPASSLSWMTGAWLMD